MRLIFPMLLTIVLAMLLIGNTIYESDIEQNETRNIYNLTEGTMIWNYSYNEVVMQNISDVTNIQIAKVGRVSNVIHKMIDFVGYSFMEIGKYFIEFGYTHPDINYRVALNLIRYYFILLIVSVAIPLVIPGIALVCILFMGLVNLIKYFKKISSQNRRRTK